MSTIIEIPLNSGMDQGTDRVLQGQDKLTLAQNCRLARDGRLELRPSFTALSASTYSTGSVTAYDVASYAGRLVALGDQGSSPAGAPTDLFEWVASAGKWRATSGADTNGVTGVRLPRMQAVRELGMLPDQAGIVERVSVAADGTYVCAVVSRSDVVQSTVHIFNAATNQTILSANVDFYKARVVLTAGGLFWVVGVDADEDIVGFPFNPASDEIVPALTTLVSNATVVVDLAACAVATSSGFATVYATAASAIVHRYTSAGAVASTWTAFATATDSVAIVANAAGSLVSVARQTSTSLYELSTWNNGGALQSGPTSLFGGGGGSGTRLGMEIQSATLYLVGVDEANERGLHQRVQQVGHSVTATQFYYDARPETMPFLIGDTVYCGWADLVASNFDVGTFHVTSMVQRLPQLFLANQLVETRTTGRNVIGTVGVSGTKAYVPVVSRQEDNGTAGQRLRFAIYEVDTTTARRQMTQVGGELLIAGGLPLTYDGRTMVEQGFAERPAVRVSSQNTTGALTQLGIYQVVAVWECFDGKGRILRSQPSNPTAVTLTGTNDAIIWRVTTPHSLRRHPSYLDQGLTMRVRVYRTEANEGVFFLDGETIIDPSDTPAEEVQFTSTQSDTQLIDNAILYTQSQAAISNVSPSPYQYVCPARERGFAGGLPEGEAWKFSKLLFPGEPVEWAFDGRLGFSGRVGQPITAVAAFETVGLVWTESEIWQIPGRGPEHNGTGEFDPSTPIATPGGTYNWQSVIVAPPGAFFQMMEDRLMLLDRGGAVTWIGAPVQDTLALFPNITGCVFVRQLDIVAFACNNALGTDGVFLVYDMTNGQWYVDTIGAAITAVAEFEGRLVYVAGGVVRLQDLTIGLGVGAMPTLIFETPSYRFFSALGFGDLIKVALLGTYLGDSTVGLEISYDDGKNWTTADTFAVTSAAMTSNQTGAALASGDPITLIWTPAKMETDRFRLRFTMTNATATAGSRFHLISLEVNGNVHTTRKPAGNQR